MSVTERIEYQPHDDALEASGIWDSDIVTANAQEYAADKSIVAVIGTLDSDAAKLMIPILNPESLVMISPANIYPGLTKPEKGEPDEPDKYYPNGKRNYSRVIPVYDLEGKVGAEWAQELGMKTVYILDDGEPYGKSAADVFARTAQEIGLAVLGSEGIGEAAGNYLNFAIKANSRNPGLIYFGGNWSNAGQLLKDLRRIGYVGRFMGPYSIHGSAFIEAAGADAAEGAYATFYSLSVDQLTSRVAQWDNAYEAKYDSDPGKFAVYGYVAATLLLDAFERVCESGKPLTDREAVRDAVFATRDFDSVLGKFSIDANGDTTLIRLSGSQVVKGEFVPMTIPGEH